VQPCHRDDVVDVTALEQEDDVTHLKRRVLYGLTTAALTIIMGLGVVDAIGWWHTYGVASTTISTAEAGYELEVLYGEVTRPALATPFEITVRRPGGFSEPIVIAVDRRYLAMWDENGVVPNPSSQSVRGPWVEWEFDPPGGTTLTVTYDGRIEPAVQRGRDGAVALVVEDELVAQARFHTRVMP
jgi:hypothetical protein